MLRRNDQVLGSRKCITSSDLRMLQHTTSSETRRARPITYIHFQSETKTRQHLFSALPSHAKSCLTQSLSVMLSHTANKALKFILFYDVILRDEGPMSYCSSPGQVYVQRPTILNTVLQNTTTLIRKPTF